MAHSTDIDTFVVKHRNVSPRMRRQSTPQKKSGMSTNALSFSISRILGLEKTPLTPVHNHAGPRPSSLSSSNDSSPTSSGSPTSSSDENSESERTEGEHEATETEKAPMKRRTRTTFGANQVRQLEHAFALSSYLSYAIEDELAHGLGLAKRQIRTWFQNRRGKQKKELKELDQFTNRLSWFVQSDNHETQRPSAADAIVTPNLSVQSYQSAPRYHSPRMHLASYSPDVQLHHLAEKRCHGVQRAQSTPLPRRGCYRYQPYRCPVASRPWCRRDSRASQMESDV